MKKSVIIFLVLLVLISLVVVRIQEVTGRVAFLSSKSISCIEDSEEGPDPDVKGTVTYSYKPWWSLREVTRTHTDKCIGDRLLEYSCRKKELKVNHYKCADGCKNGACL